MQKAMQPKPMIVRGLPQAFCENDMRAKAIPSMTNQNMMMVFLSGSLRVQDPVDGHAADPKGLGDS